MVKVDKYGQIILFMKGTGQKICRMVKGVWYILMASFIKDNGFEVEWKEKEVLKTQITQPTLVIGKKTNLMAEAQKKVLLSNIRDNIEKEKSKVKGSYNGRMETITKVTS